MPKCTLKKDGLLIATRLKVLPIGFVIISECSRNNCSKK